MTPPAAPDTSMFIAAREALLALIALAGERVDHATDEEQRQHWSQRRDAWTEQWRGLQPTDLVAQQLILTDDAALLREPDL